MSDGNGRGGLPKLADIIEKATHLAEAMMADGILQRVIEAFRLMPLEDRDSIATAVEREVQARRLSRATEGTTGQSMHPNPNARLYMRSHGQALPRQTLERDELMLTMLKLMRVSPILLVPDTHASWMDGTREALEHLDATTRAAVAQLLREALTLVDEADAEAAPAHDGEAARAS
jgi:hypothetical protein